ncbi:MAG TPA: ribonuclease HII [Candidatus Sulfotelmatobacter sp.]|nr:ribonuclease HII [Candidatus Sulfotelmatobacter sp.]
MKTIKNPSFKEEHLLWKKGFKRIVGLDEVGRGAFAGPLVAAAVILPDKFNINGIRDSKLLTSKKREELSTYILGHALAFSISEIDLRFINKFGVGKATEKAFLDCLNNLKNKFDFVLVDGYRIKNYDINLQKGIVHGDSISVSIAASSIIAKVYRDNLMRKLHLKYEKYNFFENKGYGTKYHRDALKKYGISKAHRTSFKLSRFL